MVDDRFIKDGTLHKARKLYHGCVPDDEVGRIDASKEEAGKIALDSGRSEFLAVFSHDDLIDRKHARVFVEGKLETVHQELSHHRFHLIGVWYALGIGLARDVELVFVEPIRRIDQLLRLHTVCEPNQIVHRRALRENLAAAWRDGKELSRLIRRSQLNRGHLE